MDRFLIAPYVSDTGQQTHVRPWLIPDQAFETLVNAYAFRGRVRKRFGTSSMMPANTYANGFQSLGSRVGIVVGVITGGSLAGTVPGHIFLPGQSFSVTYGGGPTTVQFTVVSDTPGPQQMLRTDGSVAPATYNVTNGAFNITATGAPDGTSVVFYPSSPIMGIETYEAEQTFFTPEPTIAFDEQFAYQWSDLNGWRRIGTTAVGPGAGIWTGTDLNYFSTVTFVGLPTVPSYFWVVNNNPADGIQYYDGTTWTILPINTSPTDFVYTALFILAFKNVLILLSPTESVGGVQATFSNRLRFSALGNPLGATSWYQDPVNTPYGGYVDNLDTEENITGFEFVKDRLIVYFEHSTYEVAYTGYDQTPFVFQKINTELGSNSPNSSVPFDKFSLCFGDVGIHACNGANVERIDDAIPQVVFDVQNNFLTGGAARTYGIRDYFLEVVYWAYVSTEETQENVSIYPNRVLCYNYVTQSWSYDIDSFTAFGYFPSEAGRTVTPRVIAGNQEGYILLTGSNTLRNAPALQITDLTYTPTVITLTIIDHNLSEILFSLQMPQYIILENLTGTGNISALNGIILPIQSVSGLNTLTLLVPAGLVLTGVYSGGGTVARISNYDIKSKEFNPYITKGQNVYISKIEYQVDSTTVGNVSVDYYTSTSPVSMVAGGQATNAIMGTSTLDTFPYSAIYPLEATQTRLMHPVYFQSIGEFLQFRIYMNDEQIRNSAVAWSDLQIHSMTLYANPSGRIGF